MTASLLLQPAPRHVTFRRSDMARPVQPRKLLVARSEPVSAEERTPAEPAAQEAPQDVCKTCGAAKADIPWGCNQEGRIQGGIGSVPGFGWWPIKAYRECPQAIKRGFEYRRKGQITDEVLFGRGKE